jgi:hypothetical protein
VQLVGECRFTKIVVLPLSSMIRNIVLFVTFACLCPALAAAQESSLSAGAAFSSSRAVVEHAYAATTPLALGNNPPVTEAIPLAGGVSALLPKTLPPLETEGGTLEDGPFHRFFQPGLTIGWRSTPVDRGQDGFEWDSYLKTNVHMLTWQHAFRILTQEKTRVGLRQPMFPQWGADIRAIPRSWGDGDGFVTNYVGHPYMGSIMGFLEVMHHPVDSRVEMGDAEYWRTRSVTLAATAAASLQFEIGPLSEASLGLNPSKQGLVDFVMTPIMGTGFLVAEDALDKYVIAKLEAGKGVKTKRFLRCALNPGRMAANLFAFRAPWTRDTRPD